MAQPVGADQRVRGYFPLCQAPCGTCECDVVEGEPDHRDSVLNEAEKARNDVMMICVSRSRSERLVLDL
jgi:hypothetical protein